jgi:hypothetical protein
MITDVGPELPRAFGVARGFDFAFVFERGADFFIGRFAIRRAAFFAAICQFS